MKKKILWPAFNLILASAMLVSLAMGGATPSYQVAPGSVITFAGATCPAGSLLADGTSYLRATYPNLFTAIGTANGTADGTHFNVPDYRGRFLRGVDSGTTRDPDAASRTAMNTGGNTANNVGSIEDWALVQHTHQVDLYSAGGATAAFQSLNSSGVASGSNRTNGVQTTAANVSSEIRPLNAYVIYCVKY